MTESGDDDMPAGGEDRSHPCPKCGSVPWGPGDGSGRRCTKCGWSWIIGRPGGHYRRLDGDEDQVTRASDAIAHRDVGDPPREAAVRGDRSPETARAMVTIGVDVASQPKGTAAVTISWDAGGAQVVDFQKPVTDEALEKILNSGADRIGLDVPLGWPDAFVQALGAHHRGDGWPEANTGSPYRRVTDVEVRRLTCLMPLSVSADRLAYPAIRVAKILSSRSPVDRSGEHQLVEVYPAAALKVWGLAWKKYKGIDGKVALGRLVGQLQLGTPWITRSEGAWRAAEDDDDIFDALVCALIARAKAVGLCHALSPADQLMAAREGWIAVPKPGSLTHLADPAEAQSRANSRGR